MKAGSERTVFLAVAAFVVLLVGALAYFSPEDAVDDQRLSTYSARSGGAKATFMLIQELSRSADRWNHPPAELPKEADQVLLIIGQPVKFPTEEDRMAIRGFLNRGGSVLFAGFFSALFLPESHAAPTIPPVQSWEQFKAVNDDALTQGVPEITMASRSHWIAINDEVVLYGPEDKAVAVTFRVGKGRVIWLGSQVPLSNVGLKGKGNVEFLANVLSQTGSKKVLWDTYFTEEVNGGHTAFSSTPVLLGGAQVLFVFGLVLWTYSRRFGPVRKFADSQEPKAQLEFVRTLASLYRSANAANTAVEIAYQRFLFLVTRRLAISQNSTPAQIADVLSSVLMLPRDEVFEVLKPCDAGKYSPELTPDEAVALVSKLQDYLVALKIGLKEERERH